MFFKHVVRHILPTWALCPNNDMTALLYRLPAQGRYMKLLNKLRWTLKKFRLSSAYELVFVYPEWVAANVQHLTAPLLVLHGTMDRVIIDVNLSLRLPEL